MDNKFTPVIGKDVIESLTIGMYEDSRFIFREYIQNSADQIDKAVREGLLDKNQGEIHISIDAERRKIIIEDNATGIASEQVQPILQNIAQSTKQRGVDKGFRGIGRLGGLAYCENLIFETSFVNEDKKSILRWDAAKLKDIINNRKTKEEAVSVIKEVTEFSSQKENPETHYFKVILENVTNDDLLDKKEIKKYLSMVAPLPFPTNFIYRSKIFDELKKDNITIDEYNIYLNSEKLYKGYSTYIYKGDESCKQKEDEIIDVVYFKEYASDGNLLYWGWHSISEKNQSLNQINFTRGFRLRKSNIQIGDEYSLLKLQRDRRFHFYFMGEIHAVHHDLIPNSRRDYFTENKIFFEFEEKLKNFFHTKIYKLCYTASEINSSIKKIEELRAFTEEFKQKTSEGFTDKKEHQEFVEKIKQKKDEAIKANKKIEKIKQDLNNDETSPIKKILDRVIQSDDKNKIDDISIKNEDDCKPKFRTDKLSSLNKEQRKLVGRIFSIIRDILEPDVADNVINKIEEELK